MSLLFRYIFREIVSSALLGTVLFTFVLFLRNVGQLAELLVRRTASGEIVLYLFALLLPQTLTFTIPMGVLVGILIGLGRMSGDGEVIAMRAAGIPTRRFIAPVVTFALLGLAASATVSLYLNPRALREFYRIQNRMRSSQLSAEVQPRVFEEGFPNTILYVRDVIPGEVVRWRGVFLADLRPPQERSSATVNSNVTGPRITVAEEAIALPDPEQNQIQLHLIRGGTHEQSTDPTQYYNYSFSQTDQILDTAPPPVARAHRPYQELNTGDLPRFARYAENWREARIELYQRLALPVACLVLALAGIPLGLGSRRSGKSTGVVVTVLLVFIYFTLLTSGISLASGRKLPVGVAVWGADIFFALFGVLLLLRLDASGDRDWISALRNWAAGLRPPSGFALRRGGEPATARNGKNGRGLRLSLLFRLLDSYILGSFLFYFVVLLASFVILYHVFEFFELLSDMLANHIPLTRFLTYLFYLTPQLIYTTAPISVLVATLVAFGVLTKRNEITAFKACGISLYRLTLPVLLASLVASGGLFVFDHYVLPESNRRQDAIRNEIKGRPVQTYLHPERQWIFGRGLRIYYYNYFDPTRDEMASVNVFEFEPQRFRLARHITAARAHWEESLHAWVFEDGVSRDIRDIKVASYEKFTVKTFPELDEPPSYFLTEVKQSQQMNFEELRDYILDLTQRGFDTVRLRVQFYKKFSFPAFAFIMGLLAVPFAFLTGNRGALAGVAVSLGIAIVYWSVQALFEQMGNVHQLPAAMAAWSPDAIFALAGAYLLLRLRT
ncbi:MAG TPA: LptF/LptG family permease [Bryobacterales bacterium]|nr:LptF/LptG family permease [Bryobacterales bacterium]